METTQMAFLLGIAGLNTSTSKTDQWQKIKTFKVRSA
jgi:hypothetical protein